MDEGNGGNDALKNGSRAGNPEGILGEITIRQAQVPDESQAAPVQVRPGQVATSGFSEGCSMYASVPVN